MAERSIKGDYIGFTFGGVHSSELGLMRVSNGSRYEQDLLPPLQDKKAQVAGRDGEIYFGSQYMTKPIKVPVAFDNMTEESFRELKRLLQDKKPKYLWFDETPYKQWLVKSANVQNFKWVCFDESHNGEEKRIYKGEGTLEFSCFSSYAESRATFLDEEIDQVIFKANGKLSLGTTPYLEILTLSKNNMDRQLFSSPTIGDGISGNKEFIIKEADDLKIINLEDRYYSSAKEYVNRMTKKGYITLSEISLIEDSDTGGISPKYGFFGIKTSGAMYDGYRIGIINDKTLKELKEIQFDDEGESISSFSILSYGTAFEAIIKDLHLYKELPDKENRYHSYNFVVENKSNPYFLIHEDEKGIKTLLQPIYDEHNILIGIEKSNLPLKILSLKGGIKDNTSLKGDVNTLQNSYNYSEWVVSSRLKKQQQNGTNFYNTYNKNDNTIYVYNAGDISTDLQLTFNSIPQTEELTIQLYSNKNEEKILGSITLKPIKKVAPNDVKLIFDSKLKMFKGADAEGNPTGTCYNVYRKNGDFFKIPTQDFLQDENDFFVIKINLDIQFEAKYKHRYI